MNQPKIEAPVECFNPTCKKTSSDTNFLLCLGCKKVRYCSKDCQRQNWKHHKYLCKHVTSNGASSASLDDSVYYEKIAVYDPKVHALADEIGVTLSPSDCGNGILRRLVFVGKDTPENISLLYGRGNLEAINIAHKVIRHETMLSPPAGSPMDGTARSRKLDKNYPPRNPREPSEAEAREVGKLKDLQERIRRYMGSRPVSDINGPDTMAILVDAFGDRWVDGIMDFQTALKAMEQGMRPPGIYD
ncbi:hypothetical protein F4804DRAFT_327346 [Jackrogersella minutella]|nr:hypothetical protein F4804DRAFT_327346 [Jackrogersella minutella]